MSFVQGLIAALGAGETWNSRSSPPKIYLGKRRVHHYEAGVALFFLGALLKSPTIAGIGAGLFLHDIDDIRW